MIGVHRSANTSAPSAIGQYWPYPSTRADDPPPATGDGSPDFELPPGRRPVDARRMTTTARSFWALGDYDRIAELVADLGTEVVAAAGVGPGMRVLDVGAGTGNAALPAAAAGAEVVATDITPELLAVGERHARERGLTLRWQVADAQALPFADGEFDAVLSCIGAMFAPDHAATARELLRVCRPGGTVVMANWTPDGGVGRFFRAARPLRAAAPTTGPPPTAWGDPGARRRAARAVPTCGPNRGRVRLGFTGPPAEVAAYYRRHFPPVIATFAGLDPERAAALERELVDLYAAEDTGPAGGPSCYELEYLLVRPGCRSSSGRHLHVHQRQRAEPRGVELLGDEVHLLLRGLHPRVDAARSARRRSGRAGGRWCRRPPAAARRPPRPRPRVPLFFCATPIVNVSRGLACREA